MKKLIQLIIIVFLGVQNFQAQEKESTKVVSSKVIKIKTKNRFNKSKKSEIPRKNVLPKRNVNFTESRNQASDDVGSTAGNLSVSLTGAANYSIPIMLPPGIKDVAPNIGLNYTNQGSNGLPGYGWDISGLSTISRVPSTKYYDNTHDGVDFKNDRFSLDGQRLILKSGSYGANGSVYQTENYSNVKVVAYGTSPNGGTYGPSYFIVFHPNGTRVWYGSNGGSRSRLEWAIYHLEDPQGNYVTYNYQNDNGLLSINNIIYGGRTGGGASMNKIQFNYITRTRTENVYVGEHNFKRTNLLTNIQVTTNGSQYRKYKLEHLSTSLNYDLLKRVTEYSALNTPLRPIVFIYDYSDTGIVESNEMSLGSSFDFNFLDDGLISGDYDGDGRTDFVTYDLEEKDRLILNTNIYDNAGSNMYSFYTGKFENVFNGRYLNSSNKISDRDAMTITKETVNQTNSTLSFQFYYKSNYGDYINYSGSKSFTMPIGPSGLDECDQNIIPGKKINKRILSGDFNGDGLTDVVALQEKYYVENCEWFEGYYGDDGGCVCSNTAIGGYSKAYFLNLDRRNTSTTPHFSGTLSSLIQSNDRIRIGDHNGDGKQDIYHFQEGKVYIYTLDDNNNLLLLNLKTDSAIRDNYPIYLGDFNGDGKSDFITPKANGSSEWKYFISKGTTFYVETNVLVNGKYFYLNSNYDSWADYIPMDVNRDGKTDFIYHYRVKPPPNGSNQYRQYIKVYINNNQTSSSVPSFIEEDVLTNTSSNIEVLGSPIFLKTNTTYGNLEYAYISGNHIQSYKLSKDNLKDTRISIVVNHGRSMYQTIDYESIGSEDNNDIYSPNTAFQYPYYNVNNASSYNLVKKITEQNFTGTFFRYQDFLYEGAVSNIDRGFQGFLSTKRSNWYGDGVSKLWTISKYNPMKKGALMEQLVLESSFESSNYISKITNTYITSLASNKVFTNIPTRIVEHDKLTNTTSTKNITYDTYNNPLTENLTYNGGSQNTIYTYVNNSNPNTQAYHTGRLTSKVETSIIGGNAFTSTEEYLYSNNLLIQHKLKGNTTPWNIESFTYDAVGNVTQKTLIPNGMTPRIESFKYDSNGRFLIESTNIEDLVTKFTYDNFGNPKTTTNPYNQVTEFSYDSWNRLVSEKNYLGKITTFSYSHTSGGGLIKTTNYPEGADEIVEYNALGWISKSKILGINNQWAQKSFEYDVAGRKIKESQPYFSSPDLWNTVAYDNYGREIVRTNYTGLVASISYNGLKVTANDGTKTIETTKDGAGNTVKMVDPGGTINYTYYGNGVMKTANYGGHTVFTEIDGWGRKIKLTDPSAGVYTYKYNSIGEVLEENTPKGSTIYTYDTFGKIVTKQLSGDETDMNLNYTYNSTTKLLTSVQGNNGRSNENYNYTYLYDSYKRPSVTKEQNGKAFFEHQITRDGFGRVNSETFISTNISNGVNSTVKVKNGYESNSGVLIDIRDFNTNDILWKINEVNANGQVKKVSLGNGISKERSYNYYNYLSAILDKVTNDNSKVLEVHYWYDTQRGNLTRRYDNKNYWEEDFTYDHLDRLTNISGSVSRTQEYDNRGRITSNSIVGAYDYGSATSYQLQNVDLNTQGDLYYQNNPLQNIKYNAYKKPVKIEAKGQGIIDFEYGIMQNRSHAYYGGNEENKLDRRYHKHYSSISAVEIDQDNEGNTKIITYIGGDAYSAPIAHVKQTAIGTTNGYHYLHRDHLGSILVITDASANTVEERQFGAWGTVDRFKKGNSESVFGYNTTLLNRGYTGHEHFMDVGLIHMNGRMYDAQLGRFLSPDNYIQEPFNTQSFNRFGYVWNNPLKFTDPSGEFILGALIGAFISVTTNGIINLIEGRGFFEGAGLAALTGAIGGVASFGIGNAVKGLSGFLKVATQAFAHGHLGGLLSGALGGDYLSGFASGAIGSAFASGTGHLLRSASNFWKASGVIVSGSLSGGIGSLIAGGKFWDGFRNGAISSALNHVAHMIKSRITIKNMLKKAGYNLKTKPKATEGYVRGMIKKIPLLKKWFELGGKPNINVDANNSREHSSYMMTGNVITLTKSAFTSNWRLLSTTFHEVYHAFQANYVHPHGKYTGLTIRQWTERNIGPIRRYSSGRGYLETQAYAFEIYLGNNDTQIQNLHDKFYKRWNK